MKKSELKPRTIFTYQIGLNEWQSRMTTVCGYANILGEKYEALQIGEFSSEALLNVNEITLWKKIKEKLENEGVAASLLSFGYKQFESRVNAVIEAYNQLMERIAQQLGMSRNIPGEAFQLANIPFNGSRCEVTPEAVNEIKEKYFLNVISKPFELGLYAKLENARDAANEALKIANESIMLENGISDLLYFDEETELMKINDAEFGESFRYK